MPVGSPGGVLNNQEPNPIQPAPNWRQPLKWGAGIVLSLPFAIPSAMYAHDLMNRIGAADTLDFIVTYATGIAVEALGTYLIHDIIDYFEGRNRMAVAERDSFERKWYGDAREYDMLGERHRRNVQNTGGY